MTRKTERICYFVLFVVLVGFLAYDWYERIHLPRKSKKTPPAVSRWEGPERSDAPSAVSAVVGNEGDNRSGSAELSDTFSLDLDWPLDTAVQQDGRGSGVATKMPPAETVTVAEPGEDSPEESVPGENPSKQEIDRYYRQLALKKSSPPYRHRLVDWERLGGEKPDWVVMEEWRNLLHVNRYLYPGPVYTSSYIDVYGNRHQSFEDRSGRIDVFDTWGRESVFFQPK